MSGPYIQSKSVLSLEFCTYRVPNNSNLMRLSYRSVMHAWGYESIARTVVICELSYLPFFAENVPFKVKQQS